MPVTPAAKSGPPAPFMPAVSTAGRRLSAVELAAMAASYFARPETAGPPVRRGRVGRWCDGVAAVRSRRLAFADYWHTQNRRSLGETGPLWVALGDSTAQGLGASHPSAGYVGQAHVELRRRTGVAWRVINFNQTIHRAARRRGLPVAELSTHFVPPWIGKFAADRFHPSDAGYRDWTDALLSVLPHR
jgi:hypothetical protein